MKKKSKKAKASVLVFSMLIMFFLLVIALGMASVTAIERKSSGSTAKSVTAFQNADTGAENILFLINQESVDRDDSLQNELGALCDGGAHIFDSDSNSTVIFKDKDGVDMACTAPVRDVRSIKSTGYNAGTVRAIEIALPCTSPYGLETNLVGLWHFQEPDGAATLVDSSGRSPSHPGTPTGTTMTNGICNARRFNGNQYVSIGDHNDFSLLTNKFSISAWVYFTNLTAGSNLAIISHWNTGVANGRQFTLFQNVSNTDLTFRYSTNGTAESNVIVDWSPQLNKWYYVTVSRDASYLYFFVNNTAIGSSNIGSATQLWNPTSNLYIGANFIGGSASNRFTGYIDEVRIINGSTRNIGQVVSDFCSGCKLFTSGIPDNCNTCP